MMMSANGSASSQKMAKLVTWRAILFVGLCCLLILIKKSEACARTVSDEEETCLVGTTPYGTFSPAPGSTVVEGATVTLTCDASARLGGTVVTATCSSAGVLSPTSPCLPCPDTTWIYDSTTDRCFKAFDPTPVPGVCTKDTPCTNLAAQYGAPTALGYTMNFQALIDAGLIGKANSVADGNYYVGIGDPVTNFQYQLDDGTPVPLPSFLPFFTPNEPDDLAANTNQQIFIGTFFGTFGYADGACNLAGTYGSICQIQLTP
uniref:Sushi domain-containing protein n=1 Tax=Plectus sambesii TaxID=2011161 RepID=A0A914WNG7_9BILA